MYSSFVTNVFPHAMFHLMIPVVAVFLLFLCSCESESSSVNVYVTSEEDDIGTTNCNESPSVTCSLRSAWNTCNNLVENSDGETNVCSIYMPSFASISFNGSDPLEITHNYPVQMTVYGNGSAVTGHSNQLISYTSTSDLYQNVSLMGFSLISFGSATINGGVIYAKGLTNLELFNMTLSGNEGLSGGSLYLDGISGSGVSSLRIQDCVFEHDRSYGNYPDGGGSIYVQSMKSGSVNIIKSNFSGTSSEYGGSIYLYSSDSTSIEQCNFTGTSSEEGGSVYIFENNFASFERCTFIGNTASSGGGIYVDGGEGDTLVNRCSFYGNKATLNFGGGVAMISKTMTVTNSNFSQNTAIAAGGGIYALKSSDLSIISAYMNENEALKGGG